VWILINELKIISMSLRHAVYGKQDGDQLSSAEQLPKTPWKIMQKALRKIQEKARQ
jgi:hypothetical protein